MIKLCDARLCMDCDCVYDNKQQKMGPYVCPTCNSRFTYYLVKFLDRKENENDVRMLGTTSYCDDVRIVQFNK